MYRSARTRLELWCNSHGGRTTSSTPTRALHWIGIAHTAQEGTSANIAGDFWEQVPTIYSAGLNTATFGLG